MKLLVVSGPELRDSSIESLPDHLQPGDLLVVNDAATLPASTKVVAFTGKPDPDEARDGRWEAPWYKKIYKFVRPTPWIAEHWR